MTERNEVNPNEIKNEEAVIQDEFATNPDGTPKDEPQREWYGDPIDAPDFKDNPQDESPDDETIDETKDESQDETQKDENPENKDAEVKNDGVEPLSSWTPEEKTFFAKLQPNEKKQVLNMAIKGRKILENTERTLREQWKDYAGVDAICKNIEPSLQEHGIKKGEFLEMLLVDYNSRLEDPAKYIIELIHASPNPIPMDYLINLDNNYRKNENLYKENSAHKYKETKSYFDKVKQDTETETYKSEQALKQFEEFANMRDENGGLLHEYAWDVVSDMIKLGAAYPDITPEEAYLKAVKLNDDVSKRINETNIKKQKLNDLSKRRPQNYDVTNPKTTYQTEKPEFNYSHGVKGILRDLAKRQGMKLNI